jgi:transcriptional antiterminator NusG
MPDVKWYIINVYSGSEDKVARSIVELAEKKGVSDKFEEILVPKEEVFEIKGGERVSVDRKYFPGYVFVKMSLSNDTWHLVRSIPRVSGVLGGGGKPSPVPEAEIERILAKAKESGGAPRTDVVFCVGDQVRVSDGPFASFCGFIEGIEEDKQRLKVSVMVFGRPTPIALDYDQVEKQ